MIESIQSKQGSSLIGPKSMRHLGRLVLAVPMVLILFVQTAYADAGTPLMWLAGGHLLFGNAIIGVVEGLLLAFVFDANTIRCILIMALANYVSMIAGLLGIESTSRLLATDISINNLRFTILAMAVALYLVTIVVEWPFCYWALKGKDRRRFRAIAASTLVNTTSYALLIPLYLFASATSLIIDAKVEDVARIAQTNKVQVYYLSAEKDALYRIKSDGTDRQKIKTLDQGMVDPELILCDVAGKPCLAIQWTQNKEGRSEQQWKVAFDSIPELVSPCEPCDSIGRPYLHAINDLRPESESDWEVRTGVWEADGLSAANKKSGKELRFALETPLLAWQFSNVAMLSGDQIVCQLGTQIVLIDLNTRRIGLLSFGVSPVVIQDCQY
jgi:hypothetical protein